MMSDHFVAKLKGGARRGGGTRQQKHSETVTAYIQELRLEGRAADKEAVHIRLASKLLAVRIGDRAT